MDVHQFDETNEAAVKGWADKPVGKCELGLLVRQTTEYPERCDRSATTTVRTLYEDRKPACAEHAKEWGETSGISQDDARREKSDGRVDA